MKVNERTPPPLVASERGRSFHGMFAPGGGGGGGHDHGRGCGEVLVFWTPSCFPLKSSRPRGVQLCMQSCNKPDLPQGYASCCNTANPPFPSGQCSLSPDVLQPARHGWWRRRFGRASVRWRYATPFWSLDMESTHRGTLMLSSIMNAMNRERSVCPSVCAGTRSC